MLKSYIKKIKVTLSDYNYTRDIRNRLFLAELSVFEVAVLEEILNSSLKIRVDDLCKILGQKEDKILPVLDRLHHNKLLIHHEGVITVNKELRKYYEFQISRFDEDFEPNMGFFQGLLKQVPIHVLPVWYAIPRTSNDIFQSIIEKYLYTPKIYRRYVNDVTFDHPILQQILQNMLQTTDFRIEVKNLSFEQPLSDEELEEYLLLLEFHCICCISYERDGNTWKRLITPFHEWREYLLFIRNTVPCSIPEIETIQHFHPHPFGFIRDMNELLERATHPSPSIEYVSRLKKRLQELKLTGEDGCSLREEAQKWLSRPIQDQAIELYRNITCQNPNDRCIRAVEKSLRRIVNRGWIYFDDFVKGMTVSVGEQEEVSLKCTGRKWCYALPEYNEEGKELIYEILAGPLFEAGMVSLGEHQERPCFTVTPFGRMNLEP